MSYAFAYGMASILSTTLTNATIPVDRIIKDAYDVDFHEIIDLNKESSDATVTTTTKDDDDDADGSNDDDDHNNSYLSSSIPLQTIFQQKVIDLYQSAKEQFLTKNDNNNDDDDDNDNDDDNPHHQKVEIRLKMIPYDTEFISLYCIPYLSRHNADADPTLKEFYQRMLEKPSGERAPDLNRLRREHLETGHMESTVIAQCVVWCNEVFYVRDVRSGKIVQGVDGRNDTGEEETKRVPHLVRMERTVLTRKDQSSGKFHNIQGDWIITDIDDLLGGNLIV
jgi:hypothetical protein